MEAYRQAGQYRVDDVVFFLRLNHSHLLTSQARWRTELGYELAVSERALLKGSSSPSKKCLTIFKQILYLKCVK